MKQLIMMALAAFSVSAASAQEKNKAETFKVYGNCGMCENRIEKAAKITGVSTAEWNDERMELTVTYDASKTTIEKVHKAIAAVGHDTDKEAAPENVYKKLPGCCKYDRKPKTD